MRFSAPFIACLLMALPAPFALAADTGVIKGAIKFDGPAPQPEAIRLSADPYCAKTHAEKPLLKQDIVVNSNGTLKNVIVYIKDGLPAGKTWQPNKEAAVLDQRGCTYEPRIQTMMVGQDLKILNSDNTIHNINGVPKINKRFNESMIHDKVPPVLKKFEKPELAVKVKCDVHPWMLAWIGVFDHPFHTVSAADGSFEIRNLPPGEYTLATWHEKLGAQELKVQVGADKPAAADFSYRNRPGAPQPGQ